MSTVEKPSFDIEDLPPEAWPDHTQLPETDGTFVTNWLEYPQAVLLTESLWPVLQAAHPDGQFAIGQDSGIYWRLPRPPEPLVRGAKSPDWFYVPGVPPSLGGHYRRSYVLWKERVPPSIILEFVSGDGSEERDRTPLSGKFWVYENAIRSAYYGIYEADPPGRIEMYHRVDDEFRLMEPNEDGRYRIGPMETELGLRQGVFHGYDVPWMRWWNRQGNLLPTPHELAGFNAEEAARNADRADRLAAQLRALGIDPEA